MKVFLQVNETQVNKNLNVQSCFPTLLGIAMSLLSSFKKPPTGEENENKKTLDGLISLSLSSVEDKLSLGKAIREKLSAFKK